MMEARGRYGWLGDSFAWTCGLAVLRCPGGCDALGSRNTVSNEGLAIAGRLTRFQQA